MTPETYIKARLAQWAMREAAPQGGNNLNAMLGMAFIIRNRVQAGWFGGDWLETIETAGECAAHVAPAHAANLRELTVRQFLLLVDDIYSGAQRDEITQGALYFAELHRVESEWFKKNICGKLSEHPRVANLGQVTLFA